MNWTPDYTCPICELQATQQLPRMGDFDEVNCPHCGRYRINDTAKEMAKSRTPEERQRALENAQSAAIGKIPVIGSREFD
jgi:Zn ribbon nucleic-acid-binding protein